MNIGDPQLLEHETARKTGMVLAGLYAPLGEPPALTEFFGKGDWELYNAVYFLADSQKTPPMDMVCAAVLAHWCDMISADEGAIPRQKFCETVEREMGPVVYGLFRDILDAEKELLPDPVNVTQEIFDAETLKILTAPAAASADRLARNMALLQDINDEVKEAGFDSGNAPYRMRGMEYYRALLAACSGRVNARMEACLYDLIEDTAWHLREKLSWTASLRFN